MVLGHSEGLTDVGEGVAPVGEEDGAARTHHHVVRTVEPLPVVGRGDQRHGPVMLLPGDAAGCPLARDDSAKAVSGRAHGAIGLPAEHCEAAVGRPRQAPMVAGVGEG